MTWYSKEIGDGVAAFGPSNDVQQAFLRLATAGAIPPYDLAVFSRYDLERNVVTVYFTPSATVLAQTFGATPCEKPTPQKGFGLVVGDQRSWEIHFPGYVASIRR